MKSIFVVAALLLHPVAYAEVTSESLCFSSAGPKSINFEMRTYYDSDTKFSFGSVKYEHSKKPIPLVLVNSQSETLDKNAPDQMTTTWYEVFGGQVTGEYEMISQGTEVASMVYTSKKKSQETGFLFNTNAITDGGCKW